jgi:hypothetical protein
LTTTHMGEINRRGGRQMGKREGPSPTRMLIIRIISLLVYNFISVSQSVYELYFFHLSVFFFFLNL